LIFQCEQCARTLELSQGAAHRCVYCGGAMKKLEEGEAPRPQPTAEDAAEASAARRASARPVVVRSREPSLIQRVIGWCLASLVAVAAALLATRNYPGLTPRLLLTGGATLLAFMGIGGAIAARFWSGRDAWMRSPVALVGLLIGGLLLLPLTAALALSGLLWGFVQSFVRRSPALFGVPVLLLAGAAFTPLFLWLDGGHDPVPWLQDRAASGSEHLDFDAAFALSPSIWDGELTTSSGTTPWRLSILEVEERVFRATLSLGAEDDRYTYDVIGGHKGNHLVWYQEGLTGADTPTLFSLFGGVTDLYLRNDAFSFTEAGGSVSVSASRTSGGSGGGRELLIEGVEGPPEFDAAAVYRPGITLDGERIARGRITAVKPRGGGTTRLVTAASLIPPGAALEEPWFYDTTTGVKAGRLGARQALTDARAVTFSVEALEHADKDLAAFALQGVLPHEPLPLAGADLNEGQVGWLPVGTPDDPGAAVAAEVLGAEEGWLLLRFPPGVDASDWIGAPLLTEAGMVAGLLVGVRGEARLGQFGAVNPSSSIHQALTQ